MCAGCSAAHCDSALSDSARDRSLREMQSFLSFASCMGLETGGALDFAATPHTFSRTHAATAVSDVHWNGPVRMLASRPLSLLLFHFYTTTVVLPSANARYFTLHFISAWLVRCVRATLTHPDTLAISGARGGGPMAAARRRARSGVDHRRLRLRLDEGHAHRVSQGRPASHHV